MTPYETVYERFLDVVAEDTEFFIYKGSTIEESQELITKRCLKYLNQACSRIKLYMVGYERKFWDKTDVDATFANDLTDVEVDLLANVMFEKHKSIGLSEYKAINTFFYDSELQQLNPTTERTKYKEFVESLIKANNDTMDTLQSVDEEYALKQIDYSVLD